MAPKPFTEHEEAEFRKSYANQGTYWRMVENVGRLIDTLDYERKLHSPQTGLRPMPGVAPSEDARTLNPRHGRLVGLHVQGSGHQGQRAPPSSACVRAHQPRE